MCLVQHRLGKMVGAEWDTRQPMLYKWLGVGRDRERLREHAHLLQDIKNLLPRTELQAIQHYVEDDRLPSGASPLTPCCSGDLYVSASVRMNWLV